MCKLCSNFFDLLTYVVQSGFGGSGAGGGMDPIKASLLTAITESLSRRIQNAQEMAQVIFSKIRFKVSYQIRFL